jgi:hypothetical protein
MSAAPETAARRWQSNKRWGAATPESLGHRRKEGSDEVDVSAVRGATAMTWAGWFAIGAPYSKDASTSRIYQRIVERNSARDACYRGRHVRERQRVLELGFAEALGKDIIVIAKEGTELPLDTNDIPTVFFRNQTRLEETLRSRIERLTGRVARAR